MEHERLATETSLNTVQSTSELEHARVVFTQLRNVQTCIEGYESFKRDLQEGEAIEDYCDDQYEHRRSHWNKAGLTAITSPQIYLRLKHLVVNLPASLSTKYAISTYMHRMGLLSNDRVNGSSGSSIDSEGNRSYLEGRLAEGSQKLASDDDILILEMAARTGVLKMKMKLPDPNNFWPEEGHPQARKYESWLKEVEQDRLSEKLNGIEKHAKLLAASFQEKHAQIRKDAGLREKF